MKYGTSGFTPTAPTGTQTVRLHDTEGGAYVYQLGNQITNITASTATLTAANAGVVKLNRAAGIAVRLPAATGSGLTYRVIVETTFTGEGTIKVSALPGTDIMSGTAVLFADGGDTTLSFATGADADTITFTATNTTGGIGGASLVLTDITAGKWHVAYVSDAAGTEASPFSATVAAP